MFSRAVLALWLGLGLAGCEQEAAPARQGSAEVQRQTDLALLTSLPIVFGERLSLDTPANPLLARLEQDFDVRPVDGPEQLQPGGLLLAAQPQALTAERLVALDRWVRDGGRLLLLADPELRFESSRPLGDRFRPPFSYPDTGLLAHWGLTLERLPEGEKGRDAAVLGNDLVVEAPARGRLSASTSACTLSRDRSTAHCRIGKGRVTLVADADFAMSGEPRQTEAVSRLLTELRR